MRGVSLDSEAAGASLCEPHRRISAPRRSAYSPTIHVRPFLAGGQDRRMGTAVLRSVAVVGQHQRDFILDEQQPGALGRRKLLAAQRRVGETREELAPVVNAFDAHPESPLRFA